MNTQTSGTPQKKGAATSKFLTFILDNEEYAISILKVKEIIGMIPITPIPGTLAYVRGVINLRGQVLPVIDLRIKFGLHQIPYTERTCIIMVEIDTGDGVVLSGIIVDTVSEVLSIDENAIEEPPTLGTPLSAQFISGMAQTQTGVKIILNIDQLADQDELSITSREADL